MIEQHAPHNNTDSTGQDGQNRNKTWLFHRGEWIEIDNPVSFRGPLPFKKWDDLRNGDLKSYGYERHWRMGGVFNFQIYANYNTSPTYRIEMEKYEVTEIIYAADLPDLLQVLSLITPLATCDIQRWLQKMY